MILLFSEFTVMRLTKPTLFTNVPVTCEERDLPGKFYDLVLSTYVRITTGVQSDIPNMFFKRKVVSSPKGTNIS